MFIIEVHAGQQKEDVKKPFFLVVLMHLERACCLSLKEEELLDEKL